jgi:hypothetical protein
MWKCDPPTPRKDPYRQPIAVEILASDLDGTLWLRRHTRRLCTIDKQRIAALRTLVDMGYLFLDEWIAPMGQATPATAETDAMHALLVLRADALEGCTENSPEESELKAIADAVEAYERRRWPDGKAPGGKG